ncbi:MAG TPA: thiamine phosphate synthase [Allosphingosinicella sp.]|nr:thiamine phosphate synthase [Allosphingosinicella sp.]
MQRRQPLPRLWLMTDERQGDGLWAALGRLPRGAGIVFRHHGLPQGERRRLFARIRKVARRKGLLLVGAGGRLPGADGVHHGRGRGGLRTASAHDRAELKAAERAGAALVFLSPVFPTRSHPGARTLGRLRFGLIARDAQIPVIALGGMDSRRWRSLRPLGAYGWAGIDAWS